MQAGDIKQRILGAQDKCLMIMLDESNDSAMDKLPMNVIIGTSKHVFFVDTIFLADGQVNVDGVGQRVSNSWY